jgi:hypothetical protein
VLFTDPGAPARIRAELVQETSERGFASPANAIGAAHPAPARSQDEADTTVAVSI